MQNVDLSWLRYVCYGVWAIAAALFLSARTDVRGIGKPTKIAGACFAIFVAMTTWTLQEKHSETYSPRKMIAGVVAWVDEGTNRGGSFYDDFGLQLLPSGAFTQSFTTETLGNYGDPRPIVKGDTLRLEYRVWDDKILSIDELDGSHIGWHYRQPADDFTMIYIGATIAMGGLIWFFIAWKQYKEGNELVYTDDLPDPPEEIQSLGLESK